MKTRTLTGILAILMVVALSTPSLGQETERWEGLMLNQTGIGPTAGNFQLEITDWTTDEEAERLVGLLASEGPRALEGELNGNRNGFVRMNSLGTPLGYTRQFETPDGGRLIRIVTPREIGLDEGARMSDFAFGIIELELDADGNGVGQVLPATEPYFAEDGTLVIRSIGRPQVDLTEVTKR